MASCGQEPGEVRDFMPRMSLQVSFTADEAAWATQFLESGGLLEPALDGARADAGLDPAAAFF